MCLFSCLRMARRKRDKIKDKEGFKELLAEMAPGDEVKLRIKRDGKELEIETKLNER